VTPGPRPSRPGPGRHLEYPLQPPAVFRVCGHLHPPIPEQDAQRGACLLRRRGQRLAQLQGRLHHPAAQGGGRRQGLAAAGRASVGQPSLERGRPARPWPIAGAAPLRPGALAPRRRSQGREAVPAGPTPRPPRTPRERETARCPSMPVRRRSPVLHAAPPTCCCTRRVRAPGATRTHIAPAGPRHRRRHRTPRTPRTLPASACASPYVRCAWPGSVRPPCAGRLPRGA
jgi:hypothetical protein